MDLSSVGFLCSFLYAFTNWTLVTVHQANYARILSLRATSQALDSQIRETLVLLTTTRSELLATPSATFAEDTNEVSYSELLSYARRISKFTLPPTYLQPDASTNAEVAETGNNTPKEPGSQTQTNGAPTPAAINGLDSSAMDIDAPSTTDLSQTQTTATGVSANSTSWQQFLSQPRDQIWTPWPNEEVIRRGALASIQILIDQGVDPATFDPERSAELEIARKEKMEEEDRVRELEKARMEEERRREMERRLSVSGSGGAPVVQAGEKKKAFMLETFDDDDDDEEES